jgi:hypothetical protein
VEVEENLLKWWVALYTLERVWRIREREKHTLVLARLAGLGGHGVAPPKSGPKPYRSTASFYRLFLLQVRV